MRGLNVDGYEETVLAYDAFWRGEGTLLNVSAPKAPSASPHPEDLCPAQAEDAYRWFTDPARVMPRLERTLNSTYYAGTALPIVYPVSTRMVAIQAAYLGGDYRISPAVGSGWCDPSILDWRDRPSLEFDNNNPWWKATVRLLEEAAPRFAGRALLGIPDLEGGGQILDLLRGTEQLSIDLFENPLQVKSALDDIDRSWLAFWKACNEPILKHQHGYVDCLRVWSDRPMVTVECDYSCMISPRMYEEFFLPSVARHTTMIERTIYHLDGPDAIRHLDALLSLETLNGIQWMPGAGAKPMSEWIPLLQRVQRAGKLLVIACRPEKALEILNSLDPVGLLIETRAASPSDADDLVESARRWLHR